MDVASQLSSKLRVCWLLLAFALTAFPARSAPQDTAANLFERAVELSDLDAAHISFHLKAGLTVAGKTEPIHGTLEIISLAHRWRQEINFPGYKRIRGSSSDDAHWQTRNTDFDFDPVFKLTDAISFAARLESDLRNATGKSKREKNNGIEMHCVTFDRSTSNQRQTCFDASTGTLSLEKLFEGRPDALSREYSAYAPLGDRQFPRSIRVIIDKKPFVTIAIDELSTIQDWDPTAFEPPPGATFWPTCRFPQGAKLISSAAPVYPPLAKMRGTAGVVAVYAVLGEDGKLHALKVLDSPAPELSAAALDSLRKWRYQPASCEGKPLSVETLIDVAFALGR